MITAGARVAMVRMSGGGRDDSAAQLVPVARELAARRVTVDLLSRAESAPSVHEVSAGVTRREISAGPAASVPASRLLSLTDAFGEQIAGLAGRAGSRYDVIHAFGWHSGLAALPVALELGVPFVQSFPTESPDALGEGADAALLGVRSRRYLAGQASAIVAASSTEVEWLIDEIGAPAARIWVIPTGVDIDLFRPERARVADEAVRADLEIAHDRPIIAVVGPARSAADDDLAIRALAELHSLRGWAPVLVIVTEEAGAPVDPMTATLLGVADHVRYTGPLTAEGLADLLAVSTVAVAPGISESKTASALELVCLQSAASGTPVVAHAGPRRRVDPGLEASGLLVDSRDPRAWARTITHLLDDQEGLDDLSDAARRHAEGFTWAAAATALLAVYATC